MSQDFKIQQNVKVGNDPFSDWAATEGVVDEEAQIALTEAGVRFLDLPGLDRRADDYLNLEAFNWFVVNALESAGYRITKK